MRYLSFIFAALLLSACSVFDPLVYKIDIPQGNYLEQKDIDKLRVGMTQEQVAFILGTPVTSDAFRDANWHYVYRLKPGRGKSVTRTLTIHFDEQKVSGLSGDFKIPSDFHATIDD